MNAQRRKDLVVLAAKLQDLLDALQAIRDEEQEHLMIEQELLDNIPDGIKYRSKVDKNQEAINNLDAAVDGLYQVEHYIESATE